MFKNIVIPECSYQESILKNLIMKINTQKITLFIILSLFLGGCSLKKSATTTIGRIATDGVIVLESQDDLGLARQNIPALILTLEVLGQGNPYDKSLLTLLARAYGQYAYGFYEEDLLKFKTKNKDLYNIAYKRADSFYKKGMDYGLKSLWEKNVDKALGLSFNDFEKELKRFKKKQVPSLFWTAFCWGNWINLHRDDPMIFIDLPRVEMMMKRVLDLQDDYYFGSAHSFIGVFASSKPVILGGNPELAKLEFNKAISIDNEYLIHKVIMSQYYSVQIQDKELYKKLLNEVVLSDKISRPEQKLANELAKRRALLLLDYIDLYF